MIFVNIGNGRTASVPNAQFRGATAVSCAFLSPLGRDANGGYRGFAAPAMPQTHRQRTALCDGATSVCTNMTVIKKDDIEGRVLHALEHHLMDDEAVRVFCEEYAAERNRLEKAAGTFRATREAELHQVQRDHDKLVDALLEGVPAARVKSKMDALAARQAELEALLAASPAPSVVRFHPSMAGTYRKRIRELIAALTEPAHASEATDAIRGLIKKIVLHPAPSATATGGVELVADLHGSLAALLRLATGQPVHVVTRVAAGTAATEMQLVSNGTASRPQAVDIM